MPATLNGFGTTYSKHLNEHCWAAVCGECGREERLTSFDTHEAVAVMFIPVVKLKALRVLGSCPNCERHRTLPRETWRKALDELVAAAQVALTRESATADEAVTVLSELCEVGDIAAFNTLLPLVEAKVSGDAVGLRHLGNTARVFDKPELAVKYLEQSLAVKETTETHAALAFVWALRVEPQKALPYLDSVLRSPDNLALCLLVVDAFQMRGAHGDAMRLVERIERALPQVAGDKLLKEARAASAREIKKATPTPTWRPRLARMRFQSTTLDMGKRRTTKKDVAAAAACIAAAVALYLGYGEIVASRRPLIVVNGSGRAYDVDVDGHKVSVPPYTNRQIDGVGEGVHHMTVSAEGLPTQTAEFTMSSSIVTRDFDHLRFILNPDRSAAILVESTEYTYKSEPDPDENWWDVSTGNLLTSVDADFSFVPFPVQIEVKNNRSATRTRVSIAKGGLSGALELADKKDPALGTALLKARLAFDPTDAEARGTLDTRR